MPTSLWQRRQVAASVAKPTAPGAWEVGADGALRLVVFEGPVTKRYRVIPGTDTNIDVVLAAAK